MTSLLTWLKSRFYAIAALGAAVVAALIYGKGRKDANDAHEAEQADDYIKTRKRMDEALRGRNGDDAEWLRNRGRK